MNGICNLKNVGNQATIFLKENVNNEKVYIGISSVRWKLGYNNHIHSFSHECLRNQTALSKHFWKLKDISFTPEIQWKILKRSTAPSFFEGRRNLCQEEKIQIILYFNPVDLLNQRCDLIARCWHKNKFRLFSKISE